MKQVKGTVFVGTTKSETSVRDVPIPILYNDGAYTILNCMYGSSVYDTQQMSRLIDQLVQDAQALGIETLPPYKLEGMIQAWDAARGRERSR